MLDAATEGRGDREIRSALRPMTTVPEAAAAGDAQRADEGPIRVFLVADVCVYRELLVDALANHESLEVVGHTPADIAGMAVGMTEPTVVLVDTSAGDGFSRVQALAAALPAAKIVAVGIPDDETVLLDLVEAGVAGCITAEQPLEELVEAVEAATNGELKCSPRVAGALAERVAALKAARPTANEEPTARDCSPHLGRTVEQADRAPALDPAGDREEPRPQHPRQARRQPSRRGGDLGPHVGADLDPGHFAV